MSASVVHEGMQTRRKQGVQNESQNKEDEINYMMRCRICSTLTSPLSADLESLPL